jgi:hypothetical protein
MRHPMGRIAVTLSLVLGVLGTAATHARAGTVPSCDQGGTLRIAGIMKSTMGPGGIPGVSVRLVGPGPCRSDGTSGSRGGYVFSGLAHGTYTITPSRAGCGFDPSRKTITLSTGSRIANFQATCV